MNVLDEIIPQRECYSGMPRSFTKFEDKKGQSAYLQHQGMVQIAGNSYRLSCTCGKFTVMGTPDAVLGGEH